MITNGSVTIEDGVKAAEEYAPARKVSVTLGFAVTEAETAVNWLEEAAKQATAKVDELLGRTTTVKPTRAPRKAADKPAAAPAKETVVDASPAGSDKAALEAAAGLTPAEPVKPVQLDIEDNIDDLLGEAAPVPITDAELAKAAQNKNAQMKVSDPNFSVKIRALVVEFAGPPPKKITDVPVAKRQEFLDKLRDLK